MKYKNRKLKTNKNKAIFQFFFLFFIFGAGRLTCFQINISNSKKNTESYFYLEVPETSRDSKTPAWRVTLDGMLRYLVDGRLLY